MSNAVSLSPGPEMAAFLDRAHGAFVDGATVSASADALPVHDPATGRAIAQVATSGRADVERAVGSARAAFDDARWRGLRPADRERILLRFADLVERDADFLAELETREQGKSIIVARHVAVGGAIEWMRYAAGLATKVTGRTMDLSIHTPPGTRATAYTVRQPVGVVAGIVPWNFPLSIALWKVVPALAAGCAIVLKPSEFTPLSALRLAALAIEAGVPPGVFNVVTGDADIGRMLVAAPQVAKISFTGSTAAGKAIGRTAMERMARVSLELGGKNPAIVLADADVDAAVSGLMLGGFFNQGQVCAAASRLYVEAPLFDAMAAALESAVKAMSIGPGLDPAAQVNPLVSAQHRDRVAAFLDDAAQHGAELLQGAAPPEGDGYYVRPTLIVNPDARARLNREEVFGPVISLTRVADSEAALALANDTDMGLAASLWTRDLGAAMHLVPRIDAGTVWVNCHLPIDPAMPFGGFKQSGIGRDFGPDWVAAYTEEKSVCIVA